MKLNPEQQKAVKTLNGRILVLAGAGSGKTRVIIHRIAYLIQKGTSPGAILGLTFTNKAAKEMRERLREMIGKKASEVTLSTFHSFCMQVLRKEIDKLGYTKRFTLYDEKDIQRLIKQIARDILKHEGELPSLAPTFAEINKAKSQGLSFENRENYTWHDDFTKEIYERLQIAMRAYNAVDFDSLITLTISLFENHPEVLAKYQDTYRYLMIDEYQDTNPTQFRLAELLSQKYRNLCVVGDDDQSIYAFRGSDVKNILEFDADHVIKLEQNYRSAPIILKAANAVIGNNSTRHDKKLWCAKEDTTAIEIFHAPTEIDEASAVVDRILHLTTHRGYEFKDIAILYRSNALSRNFELALMNASWQKEGSWVRGIPYEVFGGLEFSERAEIKDLTAFLRFIVNPKDQEALLRIINVPRRGISDRTLDILTKKSRAEKIPLHKLLKNNDEQITPKGKAGLQSFLEIIEEAKRRFETGKLSETMKWFLQRVEFEKAIKEDVQSEKMRQFKWENTQEFVNSMAHFEEEEKDASLADFIGKSLLARDIPSSAFQKQSENKIQLMTFHSSKGLEFKACFLIGLEDHILPHEKSQLEGGVEEERRLFYVAITRAMESLTLSMAQKRKKMGKTVACTPSRFLFEIPKNFLDVRSWKTFR